MSSPSGHSRITRRAVELLADDGQPVHRSLDPGRVARSVVARDVLDLLTLGHWMDHAQCHHFMRRYDGQSEREALAEALGWIRWKAGKAARIFARRLRAANGETQVQPGAPTALGSSQALGDALHAVQDSFAPGHAEREASQGTTPGAIRRIKCYAGAEKKGHLKADMQWRGSGDGGFSDAGWQAVHASRDLLRLIVDAAVAARPGRQVSLDGFESFQQKWLLASGALSGERNRPVGFLRRFLMGSA